MRVRVSPEALRAVREKRAWWEANREKAPRLFVEELAAVVNKLRTGADEERHEFAVHSGRRDRASDAGSPITRGTSSLGIELRVSGTGLDGSLS